MKTRVLQALPLIISLAGLAAWYYANICTDLLTCPLRSFSWEIFFTVIKPLRIYSLWALIPCICLIFVPRRVFISWFRFAWWWLILSIALIAYFPAISGSYLPDPFIKENVAKVMGAIFAIVSILIILWKSFRLSKKGT